MAKMIPFTKMVASGNDFIIIDNRKKIFFPGPGTIRHLCTFRTGIGADGVILIENSKKADFKMRIFNKDGSEPEMCGNGARCAGLFAYKKRIIPRIYTMETLAGIIKGKIIGETLVKVQLSQPTGPKLHQKIQIDRKKIEYHYLNTGVPHIVIFVENLEKVDVKQLGRKLRYHKRFASQGTNVNFVKIKDKSNIYIRTYERGVEDETLACGTGSTASAIITGLLYNTEGPINVKTRSGEVLTIEFSNKGGTPTSPTLTGTANIVFYGRCNILE